MRVNGAPALVVDAPGDVVNVITVTTSGGRVTRIYVMRNPDKLGWITGETALSR